MEVISNAKRIVGMGGIKIITDAIGVFNQLRDKLYKGISLCQEEIKLNKEKSDELQKKIDTLEVNINKAEKVLENINKILGE